MRAKLGLALLAMLLLAPMPGDYEHRLLLKNIDSPSDANPVSVLYTVDPPGGGGGTVQRTSLNYPHLYAAAGQAEFNITATFNCSVGGTNPAIPCDTWQYIDGYHGLKPGSDGCVWFTALTPNKTGSVTADRCPIWDGDSWNNPDEGTLRNGWQVLVPNDFPHDGDHSIDSRARMDPYNYPSPSTCTNPPTSAMRTLDDESDPPPLPLCVRADSTLYKAASMAEGDDICSHSVIENGVPLTVTNSVPSNPSKTFRPAMLGTTYTKRRIITTDQITSNLSKLPSMTPTPSTVSLAWAVEKLSRYNVSFIFNHYAGGDTAPVHSTDASGNACMLGTYPNDQQRAETSAMLRVFANDPVSAKLPVIYGLVQKGLDYYGRYAVDGRDSNSLDAGTGNGRMQLVLFAGLMLDDADVLNELAQAVDYDETVPLTGVDKLPTRGFYSSTVPPDNEGGANAALWGELRKNLSGDDERTYWLRLSLGAINQDTQSLNKTYGDPYRYIDGGSFPGHSYMYQTSWDFMMIAFMARIFPEMGEWLDAHDGMGRIEDYGTRMYEHGTRTLPDACKVWPLSAESLSDPTTDPSFGVTWGPTPTAGDFLCITGTPNRESRIQMDGKGDWLGTCPGDTRCDPGYKEWTDTYWACSKSCSAACAGMRRPNARCAPTPRAVITYNSAANETLVTYASLQDASQQIVIHLAGDERANCATTITGSVECQDVVQIKRMEPDHYSTCATAAPGSNDCLNGWQVNPSSPSLQGLDSRGCTTGDCNPGFSNAQFGGALPQTFNGDTAVYSIVKAKSNPVGAASCTNETSCLAYAVVFTVVPSLPADPANTFRYPLYGTTKPAARWTFSQVNTAALGHLTPTQDVFANAPSFATLWNRFSEDQIDYFNHYHQRYLHPTANFMGEGYHASLAGDDASLLARVMLNDFSTSDPVKKGALAGFIQYGLDLYWMDAQGFTWNDHAHGRIIPYGLTAHLMSASVPAIKTRFLGLTFDTHEEEMYHWSQRANGGSGQYLWGLGGQTPANYWDYFDGSGNGKDAADPYGYVDGNILYLHCCNQQQDKAAVAAFEQLGAKGTTFPSALTGWFEVTYRYVTFGAWKSPDPCSPYDVTQTAQNPSGCAATATCTCTTGSTPAPRDPSGVAHGAKHPGASGQDEHWGAFNSAFFSAYGTCGRTQSCQ